MACKLHVIFLIINCMEECLLSKETDTLSDGHLNGEYIVINKTGVLVNFEAKKTQATLGFLQVMYVHWNPALWKQEGLGTI